VTAVSTRMVHYMHHDTSCANDEGLSSFAFEMEMDDDCSESDCSILSCRTPRSSDAGSYCDNSAQHMCPASTSLPGTAHSGKSKLRSPSLSPTCSSALSQQMVDTAPTNTPSAQRLHRGQMLDDDYNHYAAQRARARCASMSSSRSNIRTRFVYKATQVGLRL